MADEYGISSKKIEMALCAISIFLFRENTHFAQEILPVVVLLREIYFREKMSILVLLPLKRRVSRAAEAVYLPLTPLKNK